MKSCSSELRASVSRGFTLAAIAVAALLAAGAARGHEAAAPEATAPAPIELVEKLGQSVPLDLELVDETGHPVVLRQLIDKPTVLTLNYFGCAGLCTPMLQDLTRVLNEIGLQPGEDFRVLTVSFDLRDTPVIAAAKRDNYFRQLKRPVPPTAWRFLTGREANTKALAEAVGFRFVRHGDDYVHPAAIMVLSPEGRITRYIYGPFFQTFDVQMALGEAAHGLVRPTVSKLLRFCFSYDPAGRRYVFRLTRVVGAGILALAAVFVFLITRPARRSGDERHDGTSAG
jgi:protein SCO1/2